MRRVRRCHRRGRRLLFGLLGTDGVAGKWRLPAVRPAARGYRYRDLRTLPGKAAHARPDAGRRRLWRPAAIDRAEIEIWTQGGFGEDNGEVHGAAQARPGSRCTVGTGAASSLAIVGQGVQPIRTGRTRTVEDVGADRGSSHTSEGQAHAAIERHEPAAAAQLGRGRFQVIGGCQRPRHHPGRRRADQRKHRGSLREGTAPRRCGPDRAGLLDKGGSPCRPYALRR